MDRVRVVALASGTGTLFQALLDAGSEADYPAQVVALVTDKPECGAAQRGSVAGIPVAVVAPESFADRAEWDRAITDAVQQHEPDWVVCVGFMRILGPAFLAAFHHRILNSHPSLLPAFPGAAAVVDAIGYGVKVTGCTVHVVDEGVDTGPVIAQRPVAVADDDTAETLHERIKSVERRLIAEVVDQVATYGLRIEGRKAIIP